MELSSPAALARPYNAGLNYTVALKEPRYLPSLDSPEVTLDTGYSDVV